HTRRVSCFRGTSLEEILEDVSGILAQVGNTALHDVLEQRVPLRSKIAVLFESLEQSPFLLWLDDFDAVLFAGSPDSRREEANAYFLEGCSTLTGRRGRVVITTENSPLPLLPDGDQPSLWRGPRLETMRMEGLSVEESALFWERAGAGGDLPPAVTSSSWTRHPFSLEVLRRAKAVLATEIFEKVSTLGEEMAVELLLNLMLGQLSPEALAVLQAGSVLPPEPSRQGLREVASALGLTLRLKGPQEDTALTELEAHGLVRIPVPGPDGEPIEGSPAVLPTAVKRLFEKRLREESNETWKELNAAAGAYYLRLAAKSSNLWHYVSAWRSFFAGELHQEAYEIQKTFVQEFLQRGYMELARRILEETVPTVTDTCRAVVLGNLAIIHKNSGNHDRALEIYEEVKMEFARLGDRVNVGRVLHQLGNTHYSKGDYDHALDAYRESLEVSTELGQDSVATATRIQIANVLYQCGEQEEALESYLGTLEDARRGGDHGLIAAVELQVGQVHFQAKRYLEAEAHLKEAEAGARAACDLRNLVKILETQGMVALERREYDVARACHDEAFRVAESLGDAIEAAAALVFSGEVEKTRLQLAEALKCYQRAQAHLESYAARGAGTAEELRTIREAVKARVDLLAARLGKEAFERIQRRG
ncbi:MAG TPA: tetratricopeptide repeat protein, partial [Planctomycetota bacterium]|nr:tetratricopeptide repeat protein [Planctomycetota bacterium]